jgi:2-C-methyl-D-erythritol 4-phosphate cytidylyltransferase/2-C-methyl-D-erythritol 2,4-cyclodiphosphate synthase
LSGPGEASSGADAIVVAAGSSSRMGGVDKVAVDIGGRPLLAWTLAAMTASPAVERIIIVAATDRIADLRSAAWLPDRVVAVVAGGGRRHESVAAGLAAIDALDHDVDVAADARVVLIHDAARPLVTMNLVEAVLQAAREHGAAIPVVPVTDTIKRIGGERVAGTVDRSELAVAQTPQGVRRGLLRSAFAEYPATGPDAWTDEAALLEACRIPVHVIPGERGNIKVTVPADVDFVRAALGTTRGSRPGIGVDSHPFGPGEPLALGGITIAGAPRLYGHSDGDVALHATCDALLGAAGLGDLGQWFPAGPDTPDGIPSAVMVRDVLDRVRAAGWRPTSLDMTIVAARPRLSGHLDSIRSAIAGLIGIPETAVNIKASTGNLAGMEGAGRGISAVAVVALEAIR